MFPEWVFWTGYLLPLGGCVIGLLGWLYERREKGLERVKREEADAQMRDIVRRGRAPFLHATFLQVPAFEGASNQILHGGQELDPKFTPDNIVLSLDLGNDGEPVRNISDDWDQGEGFQIAEWGITKDPVSAARITYRYDRAKHRQARRITLYFETYDGLKLHHIYETLHGVCELRRIDPS